ncbi:MAG: ABC transporter ATP-binding protein [Thermoplasmata archaeon]|nr:ABC transporter ATP-binding protein [Thermoplasmata archaeon]
MTEWHVEGVESRLDHFRLGPIDLELRPGRAVAILGSSGAGKTTLLRTLAGFLPVRRGRIVRDGVDITDWQPEERGLGYVPQGLGLFAHRTVERNVRFPMELGYTPDANARTAALLERFHLTPLRHRYPARLSGGELQRVALARALAADPELIVWDEPWQALDVQARHELGLVLQELRETDRVPVVVVTHDPSLAFSIADTFLVLDQGTVRWQGDAAALIDHPTDPFAARFAGYENVYVRTDLEVDRTDPLALWLSDRAGDRGVAFARPVVAATPHDPPPWEGTVQTVRPTPEGVAVRLHAGGLLVAVQLERPWTGPLPTVGGRLRFRIDETTLHPLGGNLSRVGRGT